MQDIQMNGQHLQQQHQQPQYHHQQQLSSVPRSVAPIDPWSRYERLEELGRGSFGKICKVRDLKTGEILACKLMERGQAINENVYREITNHRKLRSHPNVIGFKEVFLTSQYLGIVLEYADGGELFRRVQQMGRFPEGLARYYFQQLICGLQHLHREGVCHRDLKLENTILSTSSGAPLVKICDFGYCKRRHYDTTPNTTVGTSSYVAPEVICLDKYQGQVADVWSTGVLLYIMIVGKYPFDDPTSPNDIQATIRRVVQAQWYIPSEVQVSDACRDLLRRIFVTVPQKRITIPEIMQHEWYRHQLPYEIMSNYECQNCRIKPYPTSNQSLEEIEAIVRQAERPAGSAPIAPKQQDMSESINSMYLKPGQSDEVCQYNEGGKGLPMQVGGP